MWVRILVFIASDLGSAMAGGMMCCVVMEVVIVLCCEGPAVRSWIDLWVLYVREHGHQANKWGWSEVCVVQWYNVYDVLHFIWGVAEVVPLALICESLRIGRCEGQICEWKLLVRLLQAKNSYRRTIEHYTPQRKIPRRLEKGSWTSHPELEIFTYNLSSIDSTG